MHLVYFIDTFKNNYNIVRDRFVKKRPLVAKKQRNFNIYQLDSVMSENHIKFD